jgi:hypothetical protein
MAVSGRFTAAKDHHKGWFRVFLFGGGVEVWFGERYFGIFR